MTKWEKCPLRVQYISSRLGIKGQVLWKNKLSKGIDILNINLWKYDLLPMIVSLKIYVHVIFLKINILRIFFEGLTA